MGRAILDYVKRQGRAAEFYKTGTADRLKVFSPMFEEDEIPLQTLFRQLDRILAPGGQVLCDSSDISYVFEDQDGMIDIPN